MQEPMVLGGFHHEWTPGNHTLLFVGRLIDSLEINDSQQRVMLVGRDAQNVVDSVIPANTMNSRLRTDVEIYSVELQQMLQLREHKGVLGARYQTGSFASRSELTAPAVLGVFFPDPIPVQDFSPDLQRFSIYGYDYWQLAEPVTLVAGLSYDALEFPRNFSRAPVAETEESTDRLSPKAGLIWNLTGRTTLRGAYTRSLGGVSFDQSVRLEPTQVGGFNQAYRNIIPDALVGNSIAPTFDTYNPGLDHKFKTVTYIGIEAELLQSDAEQDVGVFQIANLTPPFSPAKLVQELDYEERSRRVTLNQLLGDHWSIGGRYRLGRAELEVTHPEVPAAVSPMAKADGRADLHELNFYTMFYHPCGFFSQFQSLWISQSNRGAIDNRPGDDFWQFNVFLGYRFPRRMAEVQIGLLNVSDQNYQLNPFNLHAEFPRERTFLASLKFNF